LWQVTSFASDNYAGAHAEVVRAIVTANAGHTPSYGADPWTRRMEECFAAHFGTHAMAFAVFNGTAANVLGLSLLLRRYEAVICAETAHLNTDEGGAPEQVGGMKLLTVPTGFGKLTPADVSTRLTAQGDQHQPQPRAVSISQPTELGTCYSMDEMAALAEMAHSNGLYLHVDGARLANAAVSLDCSLAEAVVGADVVSLGGTKNGLLGAEAVVVLRPELGDSFRFVRKQGMQFGSKMRFLAAQLVALLEGDLWQRNASHANAMAQRLHAGLEGIPSVTVMYPPQVNSVFASLHPTHIALLQRDHDFYTWDADRHIVRWMTAFDTNPRDVDDFLADIRRVTGAVSRETSSYHLGVDPI
jgi:threonine aldolase